MEVLSQAIAAELETLNAVISLPKYYSRCHCNLTIIYSTWDDCHETLHTSNYDAASVKT